MNGPGGLVLPKHLAIDTRSENVTYPETTDGYKTTFSYKWNAAFDVPLPIKLNLGKISYYADVNNEDPRKHSLDLVMFFEAHEDLVIQQSPSKGKLGDLPIQLEMHGAIYMFTCLNFRKLIAYTASGAPIRGVSSSIRNGKPIAWFTDLMIAMEDKKFVPTYIVPHLKQIAETVTYTSDMPLTGGELC
jgi:hypothetical protein